MEIRSYIIKKSKEVTKTEYDKGKIFAYKSMLNIYDTFSAFYKDKTRQSIYFFIYTRKMGEMYRPKEDEYSKGQADAFNNTFEYFRPKITNKVEKDFNN